jgi:hypothetical protein
MPAIVVLRQFAVFLLRHHQWKSLGAFKILAHVASMKCQLVYRPAASARLLAWLTGVMDC